MALYEHIFLVRQDVTAQQVEALTEKIKTQIAALGGAVTKVEPWGLKSLAFRVKKNRKAHFTLLNIAAPSEAVVELERTLEPQRGRHPFPDHARRRARGRPLRHAAQARRRRPRRSRTARPARRPPVVATAPIGAIVPTAPAPPAR